MIVNEYVYLNQLPHHKNESRFKLIKSILYGNLLAGCNCLTVPLFGNGKDVQATYAKCKAHSIIKAAQSEACKLLKSARTKKDLLNAEIAVNKAIALHVAEHEIVPIERR